MTDWPTIRAEYEAGASQRSLAKKFGIAQPTISERAKKEQWKHAPIIPLSEPITYSETDEFAIVQKAINHLATFLQNEDQMDLKDHKLFADALSQYMKIKLLAPAGDQEENAHHDMRRIVASATPEESIIIQPALPILHAISQRLQEQDTGNITPIRKLS